MKKTETNKMNNSSFSANNYINYNQSTQNAQSHRSEEDSQQLQKCRRESLVKPTWQNVCPGEVPFETLEKLNKLGEDDKQSILMQQKVNFDKRKYLEERHEVNATANAFISLLSD